MRTRLDIMANKESMRAICRAVEIAQSMMLSHVVSHALFLALYETNRKEIEKFLSACGVRGRRQLPAYSPDVKPSKPIEQCRAMTVEGKQCSRKPVEGNRYCAQHGGK